MGLAYHHANENETKLMKELMQCLALEPEFKEINLNMLVPHLHIETVFMSSSYNWMLGIGIIFITMVLIGSLVEVFQRKKARANSQAMQRNQTMTTAIEAIESPTHVPDVNNNKGHTFGMSYSFLAKSFYLYLVL